MNEQQLKEMFIQYLQQKSGAQTQQEFETYVQQLGEEGLQQEYAQFMQILQQQQVAAKKFGGMLNYIEKLRGVCPEGYEMQFFKQGGQICKKCVQKVKMENGGETPMNPIDAFKCGRKMKKKACGGPMRKKAIDKAQVGRKLGPFTIPDSEFSYREYAADEYGPRMRVGTVGGGIGKPGYEIQAEDLETRNRFTGQNDWEYTETGSGRTPNGGWSNNLYNRISDSEDNPSAGVALNYIQRRAALAKAKQGPFMQ